MVSDTIRRFVRGEATLEHLKKCGLNVRLEGNLFYEDDLANRAAETRVSLGDIAAGALRVLGGYGDAHWWAVIVSEASFIDYDLDGEDGEPTDDGELIGSVVWDLRFRNPIDAERLVDIRSLAPRAT